MIYYRFELDTSTEENKRKINPTKARALEKILRDKKFTIIDSDTGTNGARDSLLIGIKIQKASFAFSKIKKVISDLDLPYVPQESYS